MTLSFGVGAEVRLFAAGAIAVLVLRTIFASMPKQGWPVKAMNGDENDKACALRRMYLLVFLPAMFGDWLIGGHLYALYASFGYSMRDIGTLYLFGYTSSATLGTMASNVLGGRWGVIAHCATYIASCLCLEFPENLAVLCAGRCFAGIGTSLLYSSYESWAMRVSFQSPF